jgi:hypothetical protein
MPADWIEAPPPKDRPFPALARQADETDAAALTEGERSSAERYYRAIIEAGADRYRATRRAAASALPAP